MNVIQVEVSRLFNTGNYENIRIGMTAELAEGEPVQEACIVLAESCQHTFEQWKLEERRTALLERKKQMEAQLAVVPKQTHFPTGDLTEAERLQVQIQRINEELERIGL